MKKCYVLFLSVLLAVSFAGCGDKSDSSKASSATEETTVATTEATTVQTTHITAAPRKEYNPIEQLVIKEEAEIFEIFIANVGRFDNPSEVRFFDVSPKLTGFTDEKYYEVSLNVEQNDILFGGSSNVFKLYPSGKKLQVNGVAINDKEIDNPESTARLNRALQYYWEQLGY